MLDLSVRTLLRAEDKLLHEKLAISDTFYTGSKHPCPTEDSNSANHVVCIEWNLKLILIS